MDGKSSCSKAIVYFAVSFRRLCLVTVSLPLCGLLFCFVTACIFQQDDIHETYCRVYNIIPSISSITGVSPQRYLWRICIAFHIGPRLIIASVYYTYYLSLLPAVVKSQHASYKRLMILCYWLNILEIASLCGVTYVSNRENYPVHEKIFIVFMIGSLSHMLATIKVFKMARPSMTESESRSYAIKKALFITSIVSTVGLLIFFLKHRLLCHDLGYPPRGSLLGAIMGTRESLQDCWQNIVPKMEPRFETLSVNFDFAGKNLGVSLSFRENCGLTFSWFSLCEYVIASANMAFHVTVVLDFPTEELMVGRGMFSPVAAGEKEANEIKAHKGSLSDAGAGTRNKIDPNLQKLD